MCRITYKDSNIKGDEFIMMTDKDKAVQQGTGFARYQAHRIRSGTSVTKGRRGHFRGG